MASKEVWVHRVASHVAGLMGSGDLAEASGVEDAEQEELSELDIERVEWAVEEVRRRLYKMGTQKG